MGGAAEGEEALLVFIGVEAEGSDGAEPQQLQPHPDEGGEIEEEMIRPIGGDKEACIRLVLGEEAVAELRTDLIGALGDGRADRGGDVAGGGAKRRHRDDRSLRGRP